MNSVQVCIVETLTPGHVHQLHNIAFAYDNESHDSISCVTHNYNELLTMRVITAFLVSGVM